ncbi:hypothetical protein MKX01_021566 [Papaver californicum]|nr:hypothetical protein MKX01_021566 [Papaver californicum]
MAQGNSYEEARKQRLEDNKRRFQELGVSKIANSLSDVIKKKNKIPRKNQVKTKTAPVNPDLVRRSSRPRNQVTYYKGLKSNIARVATEDALKRAMSFQSGLLSRNPSVIKSMAPSNVSMNFGLDGSVYETNYYWVTGYITTGWKRFSMDHKLDCGDALVIELIKPTRFKVYIFKVSNDAGEVKVDEPKKARQSKSAKSRNSKKAEHCDTEIN